MELIIEVETETAELKTPNGYLLSKVVLSRKKKLYLVVKGLKIRLPMFISKIFTAKEV